MFCVPSTVTRVVRVISQLRGNMLLVGVGGSGRQSLSKMAAFICEYQVFQVEVTKQYRKQEFREGEIKHREHDCIQCLPFCGSGNQNKDGNEKSVIDELSLLLSVPLIASATLQQVFVLSWLSDIKRLYRLTGVDNKPTVFLFNDSQIVDESFLEDINNILSSGEVPYLYKQDEFVEVCVVFKSFSTSCLLHIYFIKSTGNTWVAKKMI